MRKSNIKVASAVLLGLTATAATIGTTMALHKKKDTHRIPVTGIIDETQQVKNLELIKTQEFKKPLATQVTPLRTEVVNSVYEIMGQPITVFKAVDPVKELELLPFTDNVMQILPDKGTEAVINVETLTKPKDQVKVAAPKDQTSTAAGTTTYANKEAKRLAKAVDYTNLPSVFIYLQDLEHEMVIWKGSVLFVGGQYRILTEDFIYEPQKLHGLWNEFLPTKYENFIKQHSIVIPHVAVDADIVIAMHEKAKHVGEKNQRIILSHLAGNVRKPILTSENIKNA